uniref:Uncharacterized protein n=1 Tax=Solanum lycopersicum TaxID=4081 RepID=A0A3Q7J8A3_SOLLC
MDNTKIDDQRIRVDFSQSVNGSVDAMKQPKEDNKHHGRDGNSKYSKFLRTIKETRKHKGRKHRQITNPC